MSEFPLNKKKLNSMGFEEFSKATTNVGIEI
jgi:hypothetical protein